MKKKHLLLRITVYEQMLFTLLRMKYRKRTEELFTEILENYMQCHPELDDLREHAKQICSENEIEVK